MRRWIKGWPPAGWFAFAALFIVALVSGCATGGATARPHFDHQPAAGHGHGHGHAADVTPSVVPALPLDRLSALGEVLEAIADRRVVYVGETHDNYAHHLTQLEIIKRLHREDPRLAIGVEFFQQPFQKELDDYIAGHLDERDMLLATEYFDRWNYDYRLYAPIVRYARENGLPLVALNVPRELVEKVAENGTGTLTPEERRFLPTDIDRSDAEYARRLRDIFRMHAYGQDGSGDFDRFVEVQLLWDEGMAERAADFLARNPEHRMVVLAGSGHLAYGSGIPRRLDRRLEVSSAIVLNDWAGPIRPQLGDYLLMPHERPLPPAGKIGALLESDDRGVRVVSCEPGSACESAGLQKGDRLLSLAGQPTPDMSTVRAIMWDKRPGEIVTASLRRERVLLRPEELERDLELR